MYRIFILLNYVFLQEVREKFPCLECGTIYTSIFSLKFHQKVKHIEKRTFQCDECGKHLSCRNSLTTHRLTMHTKDDDERFFCSYDGCKKGKLIYRIIQVIK